MLWNCQPKSCSRWHQVSSPPPHSSQSQMWFGTLLTFFRVLSSPNTAGSQIRTTTMRQSLFASINGLGNNAQLYLIQEPWCCKQMSLGNRLTQVTPDHFLVLHVHEKTVSRNSSITFAWFQMRSLSTEIFYSTPLHSIPKPILQQVKSICPHQNLWSLGFIVRESLIRHMFMR